MFSFIFQNMSLLIVLIYSWRINVNMRKAETLEDVYYGKCVEKKCVYNKLNSKIAQLLYACAN